jgi:hypothetical protein
MNRYTDRLRRALRRLPGKADTFLPAARGPSWAVECSHDDDEFRAELRRRGVLLRLKAESADALVDAVLAALAA